MFYIDVFLMICGLSIICLTFFLSDELRQDFGPNITTLITFIGLVVTIFFALRVFLN